MAEAREISRFAWKRYRGAPLFVRWLMRLRPFICPLEIVAESVPEGSRVLDVGCGAGLFLHWLARGRAVSQGVGVDISRKVIEVASAVTRPEEHLAFEVRAPGEPWPSGPFDVVTAIDVLHHVSPAGQRAFVAGLCRTGAERIVLKDLAPRPWWKVWMNALHDFIMTGSRVYPRPMTEVASWLEAEGYRVQRAERLDRLWYSHYSIVADRSGSR